MSSAKTHGPWKTFKMYTGQLYVIDADQHPVCEVRSHFFQGQFVNDAETNAPLIAAAPDLLLALELMLREHDALQIAEGKHDDRWPAATLARALIAKTKRETTK
jgi:hypothetical protein